MVALAGRGKKDDKRGRESRWGTADMYGVNVNGEQHGTAQHSTAHVHRSADARAPAQTPREKAEEDVKERAVER